MTDAYIGGIAPDPVDLVLQADEASSLDEAYAERHAQRALVTASLQATHHPDTYARRRPIFPPRGTAAHPTDTGTPSPAAGPSTPNGAAAGLSSRTAAAPDGTPKTTQPRRGHAEAA